MSLEVITIALISNEYTAMAVIVLDLSSFKNQMSKFNSNEKKVCFYFLLTNFKACVTGGEAAILFSHFCYNLVK